MINKIIVMIGIGLLSMNVWASSNGAITSSISVNPKGFELTYGAKQFTLNNNGQLFFGVHPVGLKTEQQDTLIKYYQSLMALQSLEAEIQRQIPALKDWQTVKQSANVDVQAEVMKLLKQQ